MPELAWVDSFAMRLSGLVPELSPPEAVVLAKQAFADACDLDPKEAAEIFALELPPADVGAP